MPIPFYRIHAFTNHFRGGNPAVVCLLESWLPEAQMLAIAAENQVPETAFFVRQGTGYHLRWFTPEVEVDLCGHATLATAFVVFQYLEPQQTQLNFQSLSGELKVTRQGDWLWLDFPARPPQLYTAPPEALHSGLGGAIQEVRLARDFLVIYASEAEVQALQPRWELLMQVKESFGIIVTAPSTSADFVCRFFAPRAGIPEDPVTGSAYCSLIPYWAERLGKTSLKAWQRSSRGGEVQGKALGSRVGIGGQAVLYAQGTLF